MFFINEGNKKVILILGSVLLLIFSLLYANKIINRIHRPIEQEQPKQCVNGHMGKWVEKCICDNPLMFSGKYCDEKPVNKCATNKDCPNSYFCLSVNNEGSCYKANIEDTLNISGTLYSLSDSILSYDNALSFCSALGTGYRPISRKDFNCDGLGAGCLDRDLMIKLQEKYGNIGFFWLERVDNSNDAYYADFNDGTVYFVDKNNFKFNQVLCKRDENE